MIAQQASKVMESMDPELAQLARVIDELSRRVQRLEQIAGQGASAGNRPYVVSTAAPAANLESRLGSQYLNRAGVIALLVGIAFFLNWAFANHWIGPIAVVLLGFVAGFGLLALGEWFLRRTYRIFGFSLEGLGIAALYLSLWAASQYYQILLPWAAFAGMVLLTAATAFIALARDSEALAVFAAIGGFGTPLLLSTGRNLELELFTYVVILCAGMLLTLRYRPWIGLLLTSFAGALAVSIAWFASYYGKSEQTETLIFSTVLFATFTAAPILADRGISGPTKPILMFVAPASTLVFLLGVAVVQGIDQFIWVAQLAAIVLLVSSWLWCRAELRAVYFITGIAVSAAGIPVSLDAHWTTSAIWLAYGVVLMMFGFLKKASLARWVALVLIGITVLKVFVFDLSNLGQGYRILALSILGIALLSISFLYQRHWLGLRKQ